MIVWIWVGIALARSSRLSTVSVGLLYLAVAACFSVRPSLVLPWPLSDFHVQSLVAASLWLVVLVFPRRIVDPLLRTAVGAITGASVVLGILGALPQTLEIPPDSPIGNFRAEPWPIWPRCVA